MFSSPGQITITTIESKAIPKLKAMVCDLTQAYINAVSVGIREDKRGRRKVGLALERIGDERRLLTEMGELVYRRDYYLDKNTNHHRYPVDELLGIENHQRVSDKLGLSLASAASEMSYGRSSRFVIGGAVSRQTVMAKVRNVQPIPKTVSERKSVNALHVDADEDHVTLTSGKKGIVPLVSVYEGIGQRGKRRHCKEVFHISAYGLDNDRLWEKVLDGIDTRYDLENTTIYLHGDGAAWIKTGLEWLPNCKFVLDKYHKNQAIMSMCAGMGDQRRRRKAENSIRDCLVHNDSMLWSSITETLLCETPWRESQILNSAEYLWNHRDGISICATDHEANNGGCSEPHVSHILSARLSDRPRVWSKTTLTSMAPILASRGELEVKNKTICSSSPLLSRAVTKARMVFKSKRAYEPRTPCVAGTIVPIAIGKINPTYTMLRHYAN
jgi:hypothetical protein